MEQSIERNVWKRIVYSDEKGTKVDYEGKDKGVLIPRSVYQDIIDLYLDEDKLEI